MNSLKLQKPRTATAFLWTLLGSIAVLLPFVLLENGLLAFGNGNTQQLQLYQQAHSMVCSGNFAWCSAAGLGSGFVDGYACGILGSPFFWLTVPFAYDWLPYWMAPLFVLKMACAALSAALFLRRHVSPPKAVMAGVLYALGSGCLSVVLLEAFPDTLIWFPVLLLGVERSLQGERRGLFALALFMTTLANGRFVPVQLPLFWLYWLARRRQYSLYQLRKNHRRLGLWAECLLGLAAGAVLAVPDIYGVYSHAGVSALLTLWQPAAIAGGCLLVLGLVTRWQERHTLMFLSVLTAVCLWLSAIGGWGWLAYQRITTPAVTLQTSPTPTFDLPQEQARWDAYGALSHPNLYSQYAFLPSQSDHKAVADLYQSLAGDTEPVALSNLLSVRWLLEDLSQRDEQHTVFETDGITVLPGWQYHSTQHNYAIYKNTLYIPMGFTYESYITRSEYLQLTPQQRDLALLKALVVEDADQSLVEKVLLHRETEWMSFSMVQYPADCADRAANAATTFEPTRTGFRAAIMLDTPQVVFFSLPYSQGWTATVNGQSATLLQANLGFIAVMCPAGETVDIRLDYHAPCLQESIVISVVGLVLMGWYYLALCRRKKEKEPTEEGLEKGVTIPGQEPQSTDFDLYSIYIPKQE